MAKVEGKKANTQAGCASCDFRRDDGSLHQSASGYEDWAEGPNSGARFKK